MSFTGARVFAPRRLMTVSVVTLALLFGVVALHGERPFVPNGLHFFNENGTSMTYSTTGGIDLTNPFFQNLGSNGRSCGTCHQPGDGMSVSASGIQERFDFTRGLDPIFRPVDGSNCNHDVDLSTLKGRRQGYSLLRTRGLIRIAIDVPATADFAVVNVDNPYLCNETEKISMYRRPLPAANLQFLSAVMFDGRESTPLTGTTKIGFDNYPASLLSDLAHQSVDATTGHAQGDGTRPTPAEQQEIVDFEMALFTAQAVGETTRRLDTQGANGGPGPLVTQPFFISINSSVNFLLPGLELPGGLMAPGDGGFSSAIFDIFDAWAKLSPTDPRAAVARGQAIFNSKPINITGVAGINDDVSAGGLVSGGMPSLKGTCGTCHDTPNVGNHSFPTPLNIWTGDFSASNPPVNLGGLDVSYLPCMIVCKTAP